MMTFLMKELANTKILSNLDNNCQTSIQSIEDNILNFCLPQLE
jgi:hypothetical protein